MAFIYEFLYRGRADDQPPGWHLVLAKEVEEFGKKSLVLSDTLTMAQAKEAGFDLPQILREIGVEALTKAEQSETAYSNLAGLHHRTKDQRAEARQRARDAERRVAALQGEIDRQYIGKAPA